MAIRRNFVAPTGVSSFADVQRVFQQIADLLNRALRSNAQFGLQQHDFSPVSPSFTRVSAPPAGIKCTMPPASADNNGDEVAFNIERNAGPLVVYASPQQFVNGAATATLTANGLVAFRSNGVDSWTSVNQLPAESPGGVALGAEYVLGVANASLPNGRVATASAEITPDRSIPNVMTWALNAGSVVFAKLQNLAGLSVLGRAANSTGVMSAITAGAAGQYLRSNVGGTSLEFADPASASIINAGGTFQSAAISGAVTAAQNSNVTAFGTAIAKSVLANATNVTAVPAYAAGTASFQHLRVNAANSALEWSVLTSGDFPPGVVPVGGLAAISALSVVANATNASAIPTAVAGSSALQYFRVNAAATALEWGTLTVTSPITVLGGPIAFDQSVNLGNNARVAVAKNSGAVVGARRQLNLIEGTNITITEADDSVNERVNVTIAAAAAATPTWATVLVAGNISGATSPLITTGQSLNFGSIATAPVATIRSDAGISIGSSGGFGVTAASGIFTFALVGNVIWTIAGGHQVSRQATVPAPNSATGVWWAKTQDQVCRPVFTTITTSGGTIEDWPLDSTGVAPQLSAASVAAATTVMATTATRVIPAGTLIAGSKFKCTFNYTFSRGATLTAVNLNSFFDINTGVTGISVAMAAPITTGTFFVHAECEFTVLTVGIAGTCMANMMVWCTSVSGATGAGLIGGASNVALALNTTVANSMRGAAQMNAIVAATSIQCTGGNIERVC